MKLPPCHQIYSGSSLLLLLQVHGKSGSQKTLLFCLQLTVVFSGEITLVGPPHASNMG